MRVIIEDNYNDISNWVSLYIKEKINKHNINNSHRPFILGLPTGSTPLGVYRNLIKYNFFYNYFSLLSIRYFL